MPSPPPSSATAIPVIEQDTLYIAVSQSGETFDTLAAVQEVKRKGGHVLGIVNVVGSTIARECGRGIYLHAGPEVAVVSTKTFTCTARRLRAAGRSISAASAICRRRTAGGCWRRWPRCPNRSSRSSRARTRSRRWRGNSRHCEHAYFVGPLGGFPWRWRAR